MRDATFEAVVSAMLDLVPAGFDLVAWGPAALAQAFPPLRAEPLEAGPVFAAEHCECDGWYDRHFDPARPVVYYRADVTAARVAFTLAHETGHHLIWSVAPGLLDDVDRLAGPRDDPGQAEERVCNEFAGRLLVPDRLVDAVVGNGPVRPSHVGELVGRSEASWQAVAVRLAGRLPGPSAVVLVRDAGSVGFSAPSPGLRASWPAGSPVDPAGPLARALTSRAAAARDTYRHGLTGEEALWCDILPVHPRLSVAVMSWRPSDGRVNLLDPAEPALREPLYCERCTEPRTVGWCDRCRGPFCSGCGTCGCWRRPAERLCPSCGYLKGPGCWEPGATICNDCR